MATAPGDLSARRSHAAHAPEPLWSRWLDRLVDVVRGFSVRRRIAATENREPIYRIAQVAEDRWEVERPGAVIEHAFPDLEQAVAFIRSEATTATTVELRIGDLYVVSRFDPLQPGSLFGERAP